MSDGLPQSIQSPLATADDNRMRETFMPMSEGYMRASMNKRHDEYSANQQAAVSPLSGVKEPSLQNFPTTDLRREKFKRNTEQLHVAFSHGITKIAQTAEEMMAYDRMEKKDRELIEKA